MGLARMRRLGADRIDDHGERCSSPGFDQPGGLAVRDHELDPGWHAPAQATDHCGPGTVIAAEFVADADHHGRRESRTRHGNHRPFGKNDHLTAGARSPALGQPRLKNGTSWSVRRREDSGALDEVPELRGETGGGRSVWTAGRTHPALADSRLRGVRTGFAALASSRRTSPSQRPRCGSFPSFSCHCAAALPGRADGPAIRGPRTQVLGQVRRREATGGWMPRVRGDSSRSGPGRDTVSSTA